MSVSAAGSLGLNVVGLLSRGRDATDLDLLCNVLALFDDVIVVELAGQLRAESRVANVRLKQAPSGKSLYTTMPRGSVRKNKRIIGGRDGG